jgi:hypothetical protein
VCEQIVATIVRFDEAKAFCVVEPFHGASRHVSLSQEIFLTVMSFAGDTWLSDKASLFQTVR